MKSAIVFSAVLIVVLACMITDAVAEGTPKWQLALQQQLQNEHQCELNYLTNLKVQTLGAIRSIEARAHCMDGEAYDIRSLHGSDMFEIRACGMTIC